MKPRLSARATQAVYDVATTAAPTILVRNASRAFVLSAGKDKLVYADAVAKGVYVLPVP